MDKKLAGIAAGTDQKAKIEQYKTTLAELIASKNVADAKAFVDHMASESTPLVISRVVLQEFAVKLRDLGQDLHKEVAIYTLERVQPRVVAFEEQISTVREDLAAIYEENEEWIEAAKTLIGIPLESQRLLTADHKADKYVKIAQLYLEEDEHFEAERYVTKASVLMPDVKDKTIIVRYKACFAKISKFKRKFLDAAMRYYELSQILSDPAERLFSLETAVVCAIMAPAGPQRSRQLATYYKDERSAELPIFGILEKMFLDRILRKDEFIKFVQFLKEREFQIASVDHSTTVLDKAVREHNLLSSSRVYNNIKFEELALLLDVEADEAEKLASTMITENRLHGHIDQLERIIYFQEQNSLELWDTHISSACTTVNSLIDLISAKHPVFLDKFHAASSATATATAAQ